MASDQNFQSNQPTGGAAGQRETPPTHASPSYVEANTAARRLNFPVMPEILFPSTPQPGLPTTTAILPAIIQEFANLHHRMDTMMNALIGRPPPPGSQPLIPHQIHQQPEAPQGGSRRQLGSQQALQGNSLYVSQQGHMNENPPRREVEQEASSRAGQHSPKGSQKQPSQGGSKRRSREKSPAKQQSEKNDQHVSKNQLLKQTERRTMIQGIR